MEWSDDLDGKAGLELMFVVFKAEAKKGLE